MTLPAAVAAEVRFLESGRNTRLDTAAHCFTVRSESGERTYQVTIASQGAELRGTCTCPGRSPCPPRDADTLQARCRDDAPLRAGRAGHVRRSPLANDRPAGGGLMARAGRALRQATAMDAWRCSNQCGHSSLAHVELRGAIDPITGESPLIEPPFVFTCRAPGCDCKVDARPQSRKRAV